MTQLTINVEDKSILPHLKKILNAIDGVSIVKPKKKSKSGLEIAYEDLKAGHVKHFDTADDFFKDLGI